MVKCLKIILLTLFLVGVAGLLLFGPRPQTNPPAGRVVVTYWEKWTGREAEQMQQIVDDFNQTVGKDKGIYVHYVSMSQIDRKTLLATAAGVPPDIAGMWYMQLPQFAALDACEPLGKRATAYGITAETYKPVYWEGCLYDGELYGLVSTPWAVALHWNKELLEQHAEKLQAAGLNPEFPFDTLANLDRAAEIMDGYGDGGKLMRAGYLPMEPPWFVAYTPFWFGASLFDEQAKQFTLTTDDNLRAYEWVQSYSKRLGRDAVHEFRGGLSNYGGPNNPFVTGYVAMLKQGPWTSNFMEMNVFFRASVD